MRAHCLIRSEPWYRREAFVKGLRAAGHDVVQQRPVTPDKNTLLVIWNRYATHHEEALRVERAGGRILVAENGYLGKGGGTPKFQVHPAGPQPGHYYALAEGWHNGRGRWPVGGPERFERLEVELKPWREGGEYALVAPNRSFGVGEQLMHPDWAERKAQALRKQGLKVVVRNHPGNNEPKRPLSEDLKGASAVYIWSSSVGVHALVEGIPVHCDAPYWICKGASGSRDDATRRRVLRDLAWAQWTCEEIESGEPFRRLLQPTGESQVS